MTTQAKEKATILLINSFGMPIARQVWLYKCEMEQNPNNFYSKKMIVHYTEKGKRKIVGFKLQEAVVARGWQDVKGCINTEKSGEYISFQKNLINVLKTQLTDIILECIPSN
jgi:hypothetical protein